MEFKIALSTCWNSHRHEDGYSMLKEIAELGFNRVELSHGTRFSLIPGIMKAYEEGWMKVGSLHNFCPLPPGITGSAPNLFLPTSKDAPERNLWHKYTLQTLDFAARFQAKRVVVHLGSVSFFWLDPVKKLEDYAHYLPQERRAELLKDSRYQYLLSCAMGELRQKAPHAMERLYNSLDRIIPEAQKRGIRLGFENREDLRELPLDAEMAALVARYIPTEAVGYWHDAGHAQLKEDAGVLRVADHLKINANYLIGWHLHDVHLGKDHRALGTGHVNFNLLRSYMRPEHNFTLELSPSLKPQEVLSSKAFLENLLNAPAADQSSVDAGPRA
ncbi:MAG: hypothetical protein B7X06_00605 [Verrucomicrobia bacterium 21-51-4]|nr:MAG: hypothetical protein B7X06_00605 [Verrucomicrobia bacterium 21-51-4]HQU08332.1 sugar phosphate isomerase/epimerase [Opitutales bacterium]